ncbi:hypothetical protein [Glycomyces sp. NRRL B-16210]|uniref:hypothetical protein n=1 Tax=Glycomyces sp. NRRL B-16210 TaxID=1463821 RepID=UPI0004C2A898|nr:hypothetical protein [Glycomyces sp. NRRL B-16210]
MPSNEPVASRTRREGLRVGWIMVLSALSLVPIAVWNDVREPDTAVEVVTAFMEAVRDRDLDRAYGFIGTSVPSGPDAVFLHPDAISDWDLLAVEPADTASGKQMVRVVIGTEEGTAAGAFAVSESKGRYLVEDPFQTVALSAGSYLSLQVNDRVVPRPPETTWQYWYGEQAQRKVELLPGVYRFFGGEAVALLGDEDAKTIGVPLPDPAAYADSLQHAVNEHIDACVEYRRVATPGCPFATDGQVDTLDLRRVNAIRDPVWTVEAYPVVTAVVDTGLFEEPVLTVAFTDPGRITLQGEGTEGSDVWEAFTAACRFGGSALRVLVDLDGTTLVAPLGPDVEDTCRGTQSEGA